MSLCKLFKATAIAASLICVPAAVADELVIVHTNDTHSQLDPDDKDNLGGVGRRKVLVDSIRAAHDNVLLVDAGDAVQGTLYFNLYGGKVEQLAMNALGYNIRILGNHEFDNGADSLAHILEYADAEFLATNYDLEDSPLEDMFERFTVREYDGVRIGFMAINLEPKGMISEGNYDGVEYLDAVKAADAAAWWLRNIEHCDLVVAITHIGYNPVTPPGDMMLARQSENIDIIIGGHSHDLIAPGSDEFKWLVPNANGKDVLVAQVGKSGKNIGEITIDLDNLKPDYKVIQVDSRLDSRVPAEMEELLAPYRAGVDSLMTRVPVGMTKRELTQRSPDLLNWATDFVLDLGRSMAPDVDLSIINKGGLRRGLPKGTVNEGQIITLMPFNNRVQVIDIKGKDLLETFEVMARAGGNGVSRGVDVAYIPGTPENNYKDAKVVSATIDGKPVDPDRTYRVATIDYLANGGDYMEPLRNHTLVAESDKVLYKSILDRLRSMKPKKRIIDGESTERMHPAD